MDHRCTQLRIYMDGCTREYIHQIKICVKFIVRTIRIYFPFFSVEITFRILKTQLLIYFFFRWTLPSKIAGDRPWEGKGSLLALYGLTWEFLLLFFWSLSKRIDVEWFEFALENIIYGYVNGCDTHYIILDFSIWLINYKNSFFFFW